jgi:SNF2 family DNA or RNA helicase
VLYPFQASGVQFAVRALRSSSGAAYIAHPPGFGKSLTAILCARALDSKRVLVVTTKAGLGVWRAEFERWWPGTSERFVIINYDRLTTPRLKELLITQWDLLILDEAQAIKQPSARRSRACAKLARTARSKLLLSGTPAHSPLDYWHPYRLIAPGEWPWNLRFSEYRQLVAHLSGPHNNWVVGFRQEAVARVTDAMRPHTHVATQDELALPEPVETIVPVSLSSHERRAYEDMRRRLRVELADGQVADAAIVLTKILRLQQITSGFVRDTEGKDHTIGSSKLEVLHDLLDERSQQKIVIAYRFVWERDRIKHLLEQTKRQHAIIDGSTSSPNRDAYVRAFQNAPHPRVLLLQEQAGGTSITLSAADSMIVYSIAPSVITWEQLKARIHRIGTTTHKQYLYLLADDSIDGTLLEGLKAKADVVALTNLIREKIEA